MNVQDILQAVRDGRLNAEEAKAALQRGRSGNSTSNDTLAASTAASTVRSTDPPRSRFEPIAIVGMSGRYPQAPDLDAFWDNLVAGRDCISEVPSSRWDIAKYYDPTPPHRNKLYCKWLGVLDDIECFDPLFFRISPAEAQMMDPQHRLFLEESYKALEDAGYGKPVLSGTRCGVYFGIMSSEYGNLAALDASAAANTTGNSNAIGAARLAYYLNLKGPAIALDTACSSSLVATHLACQALRNGEIDMAVAGGATLYLSVGSYIGMCAAGMLSPSGRCKTFDNSADGFVPGEGAGVVVLKRLSDAERDGDAVAGLIIGSGLNQDGKTNGITAPCKESQIRLTREIYATFAIDPASISYVEMHGTGTKLGDPIELQALATIFAERTENRQYCAIGSVKSNIGHTSAAAGVAGIHKVLLAMRAGMLVPTLNFTKHNEHFDFASSPFHVNTRSTEWRTPHGAPRRAAVSSFGYSGTNAHLVMEEYVRQHPRMPAPKRPELVIVSASNAERLRKCAERLRDHLDHATATTLRDIAFTLQVGRDALEARLAIVTDDLAELRAALAAFSSGATHPSLVQRVESSGQSQDIDDDDDALWRRHRGWWAGGAVEALAREWLGGASVDWLRLRSGEDVRRVRLPTYPFERGRYWLPRGANKPSTAVRAVLHPLLHVNASGFDTVRFRSTFDGEEFFLAGHTVGGTRVMPGVAYIEMAYQALLEAAGESARTSSISITDLHWLRALTAGSAETTAAVEVGLELQRTSGGVDFSVVAANDPALVYCEGCVRLQAQAAPVRCDVPALRARFARSPSLAGDQLYAVLEATGLRYGAANRGLLSVRIEREEALAEIALPDAARAQARRFAMHPTLLDAACQATVALGLTPAAAGASGEPRKPSLPFAVDCCEIRAPTTERMWAWVRRSQKSVNGASLQSFDVDLYDEQGALAIRILGLTCKSSSATAVSANHAATPSTATHRLVPVWHVCRRESLLDASVIVADERVLLVGGSEQQRRELRKCYSTASELALPVSEGWNEDTDVLCQRLVNLGPVEHIVLVAPEASAAGASFAQEARGGSSACFHLIKALLKLDYWSKPLRWTVITVRAQSLSDADLCDSRHAGIHGLIGAMTKEYPNWQVRLVDLDAPNGWPTQEIARMRFDPSGDGSVLRNDQWHRRRLAKVIGGADPAPAFRHEGRYVVIGGAGGIGEAWTEYVIRRYGAHVAWIGRRERSAEIVAKLDRLAALGPRPHYICADASDRAALQGARAELRSLWGAEQEINGVVHSAIVLLDKSLAKMKYAEFDASLRAKIDTAANLEAVFGTEPLDFALFFSSVQSFSKERGQSNYAAACTFADSFAYEWGQRASYLVKTVNWGYWGSIGVVAAEDYRQRMLANGIGSIEPDEGMAVLEELLAGPLRQLGCIKAEAKMIDQLSGGHTLRVQTQSSPSAVDGVRNRLHAARLAATL